MTGPWSPFDYCHILEVFAVPVVTQPVLSAFVMAAALGLLRVRRAGGLRSDEPLEKTAHRLLCEWRRCRHVLRQTINLLLEKDSKFSIVSIEYRVIWRNLLLIYNIPTTVLGIPTTRVLWNQFREKAPDLCINYLRGFLNWKKIECIIGRRERWRAHLRENRESATGKVIDSIFGACQSDHCESKLGNNFCMPNIYYISSWPHCRL